MKHLIAVAALSLLCLAPCCLAKQSQGDSQSLANQPATAADIQRYYATVHIQEQMKATMAAVSEQMRKMTHQQLQNTPNLPPGAEEQMDKMLDTMLQKMPIDDMLQSMVPVYEKHFTKGDIDAMIAFYATPTGKKMQADMPEITREAMQAAFPVMQKYMTETMKGVQDQIAQMAKDQPADQKKSETTN
ncbi:MAG: DUF2059 domain-containing protein [Candidatus Acidiferrales bacterium]